MFGALTSCSLKVSDHFYGTGESLLFRFAPDCQVYNWTGDNMYFIKGNNESLSIGAGESVLILKLSTFPFWTVLTIFFIFNLTVKFVNIVQNAALQSILQCMCA